MVLSSAKWVRVDEKSYWTWGGGKFTAEAQRAQRGRREDAVGLESSFFGELVDGVVDGAFEGLAGLGFEVVADGHLHDGLDGGGGEEDGAVVGLEFGGGDFEGVAAFLGGVLDGVFGAAVIGGPAVVPLLDVEIGGVVGAGGVQGGGEGEVEAIGGGAQGGGYASINLPEVHAIDYQPLADYILHDDGVARLPDGTLCGAPCSDWAWTPGSGGEEGTWGLNDNDAEVGTFYVETSVTVAGSPSGIGNNPIAVSIISEGSILITGSPRFEPENAQNIQFVTDGDLMIGGAADLDAPAQVNGQIFVREQIHIAGNPEFQGRIIVTNEDSVFDDVLTNAIPGTPTITYNGGLGGFTTYTFNVSGWIEQ